MPPVARLVAFALALALPAGIAAAQPATPPPQVAVVEASPEPAAHTSAIRFGVGYRATTSHGPLALDLIALPWRRIGFELELAPIVDEGARGVVFTPKVRLARRSDGSTPFLYAGYELRHVRFGDVSGLGSGFVADAGYELAWRQLRLQGAVGVRGASAITGREGMVTVTQSGLFALTASFAVRYLFQ